jgi:SRSO17 transposase
LIFRAIEMAKRELGWKRELLWAHARISVLFARSESGALSLSYLQGLLSGCERKNGWQLAEWMGEAAPHRMQHLLDRAGWDADRARDEVRADALEALGEEEGVLIVDETGFLKKGVHSVGVKRQDTGTAGRIENSQVGVFLCYAGRLGAALVDRELYLPEEWVADADRLRRAELSPAAPMSRRSRSIAIASPTLPGEVGIRQTATSRTSTTR